MRDLHQQNLYKNPPTPSASPFASPVSAGTTLIFPHQHPSLWRVQRASSFHFTAAHQQGRESGQHHAGSLPFGTSSRCRGVFSQRKQEDEFLPGLRREREIPFICQDVSDRYFWDTIPPLLGKKESLFKDGFPTLQKQMIQVLYSC